MRGAKAKAIRKRIYGDFSPRFRKYIISNKTGQICADPKRDLYQKAKRGVL